MYLVDKHDWKKYCRCLTKYELSCGWFCMVRFDPSSNITLIIIYGKNRISSQFLKRTILFINLVKIHYENTNINIFEMVTIKSNLGRQIVHVFLK